MSSKTVLVVSGVLNLALVGVVFALLQQRPTASQPKVVKETVTNVVVRGAIKRVGLENTNLVGLITNLWRQIESPDYRTYIANLRGIGCPEETIRDIIITDLNKLYAQKAKALNPAVKDFKFWRPDMTYEDPKYREYQRQLSQLEKEKRDTVRVLLGVELAGELAKQSSAPNYWDRQLAFLPEAKRSQFQSLMMRYQELEQEIYDQAGGDLTVEHKARLEELRRKRQFDLAALLSPAEVAEYDMRTSATAQDLRYRMGAFNGTEEDFRNIYRVQKSLEERLAAAANLPPAQQDAIRQAAEQELKSLLGDRYAEYQRTQDGAYREVAQVAQRNNLPKETATAVHDMKKVAEEQRKLLLAAAEGLPAEQRAAAFAALREETERSIRETLGEQAFKDYLRRGGNWLIELGEPPPQK